MSAVTNADSKNIQKWNIYSFIRRLISLNHKNFYFANRIDSLDDVSRFTISLKFLKL